MLEVKNATIAVGNTVLLNDLSFIARDGELTCITGSEGVGKTTLLRTLMGFLPVSEGFVSVEGELLTIHSAHSFRSLMVYLPQETQALRYQLSPAEVPACEAEEYAVWNTALPSVKPVKAPEPLSAEEIFQLAERTLQEEADRQIVIADEPAACLTLELTLRMMHLLMQQVSQGKTVLIASRKPQIVAQSHQVIDLDQLRKWTKE